MPASRQTEINMTTDQIILTLSCTNRPGIVAAVSTYLFNKNFNILDAEQFDDRETGRFFMRVAFNRAHGVETSIEDVRDNFTAIARLFDMVWTLRSRSLVKRVMLLVSKFDHCLADILYRWRIG